MNRYQFPSERLRTSLVWLRGRIGLHREPPPEPFDFAASDIREQVARDLERLATGIRNDQADWDYVDHRPMGYPLRGYTGGQYQAKLQVRLPCGVIAAVLVSRP